MQIFVRQATPGATLIYSCSETTTLQDFLQWVEDKTAIPEEYYYILYRGRYLSKSSEDQKKSTFAELGITNEATLHLNGRLSVRSKAQKLNATA